MKKLFIINNKNIAITVCSICFLSIILVVSGCYDDNDEGNAMPVHSWTMLNLPDTGQTTSHTATWGEDSDYTINPPSYTDNGDETITDNVTGLMWQKEDDNTTRTWDDANTYCGNLPLASYTDWRLPSVYELMSIVNCDTYNPSINTTFFPGTNASYYLSSTTDAYNSSFAWGVYFGNGHVYSPNKTSDYYVRCVRAGK